MLAPIDTAEVTNEKKIGNFVKRKVATKGSV